MNEILFRGKRVDNGEWVEGGYYKGVMLETNNIFSLDNARIKVIIISDGTYFHVIPETIGQFTGLLDKNGTKIFEGDVLSVRTGWYKPKLENGEENKVVFDPSIKTRTTWTIEHKTYMTRMGYYAFGKDRRFKTLISKSMLLNTDAEIIGNIHDKEA